jgi:FKBP-type peptidyl-prolyl cis-trans isomerase
MKWLILFALSVAISGCDVSGTKKQKSEIPKIKKSDQTLNINKKVIADEKLTNGERIQWFEKGKGDFLKCGDLAMIDYRVELPDGSVVDGNHLLKKPSFPYLVGFQMQPGWDAALEKLKVGDFAKISIPSQQARGKNGVKGLIPKNADNYLIIRVLSLEKPTVSIDGVKVWLLEENNKNTVRFKKGKTITIHSMVSSPSNPLYYNSYRDNKPFMFRFEDYGIVPGFKKALMNAKKSDRFYIYIPSEQAYGNKGYLDIVKPNEPLFYNVLVMDVQ